MLLERRTVSRKTPLDGKLEVSPSTAARLAGIGELAVATPTGGGSARIESVPCSCSKGDGEGHVHHFVRSPVLKALRAGADVVLELDMGSATLRVQPGR